MSFWVGKYIHVLRGWQTPVPWGQQLLFWGPFQTAPYVLLPLTVYLQPS